MFKLPESKMLTSPKIKIFLLRKILPLFIPSITIYRKENVPPVKSSKIFAMLHPLVDFLT